MNCTVVACGPFPLLTSEHSATLTLTGQLDTATLATLPSLNITSQVTALAYMLPTVNITDLSTYVQQSYMLSTVKIAINT